MLSPFLKSNVDKRRNTRKTLNIESEFSRQELVFIQRILQNMPREVFQVANRRASVVIPLCNANGVSSILFEKRSNFVSTHKSQVCFPGGMVDDTIDASIIQTRYNKSSTTFKYSIIFIQFTRNGRGDRDTSSESRSAWYFEM